MAQQQLVRRFEFSNRSHRFTDAASKTPTGFGRAKIVPNYRTFIGEFSPPTFFDSIFAYRTDTDTYAAINFMSSAALKSGFFVTGDEEYEGGDAIKCIEDFNKNVRWGNQFEEHGLLPLLRVLLPECLYSGNNYIEMQDPEDLKQLNQVQISTIWKTVRNVDGSVKEIWQKVGGVTNQLDPETMIHIPFRTINREAYGSGILEAILRPRLSATGEVIPPWYIIKASLEYDLWRMAHSKGSPRSLWSVPDAGDEEIERYNEQLANPAVDARFVTNSSSVKIETETGGPAQGLQNIVDQLLKRYQAGLQTPFNNLLNSSGYTEASARVAEEIGGVPIADIQTRIKQAIEEEFWRRVLIQAGFDPEKARIELHWGVQEQPDYTLQDVANIFDRGGLTPEELRRMLRNQGWPLDDDSILETWLQNNRALQSATIGGKGFGVVVPPGQQGAEGGQPDQNMTILNAVQPAKQAQTQAIPVGQTAKVDPTAKPPKGAQDSSESEEDDFDVVVKTGLTASQDRYQRTHKFELLLKKGKDSMKTFKESKNRTHPFLRTEEEMGKDPMFEAKRDSVKV